MANKLPEIAPVAGQAQATDLNINPEPDAYAKAEAHLDDLAKELHPAPEPTPEEKAAAEKVAKDEADAKAAAEKAAAIEAEVNVAIEKADAEKAKAAAAEAAEQAKRNESDGLDKIEMPASAKSKSAEAFNSLKTAARSQIAEWAQKNTEATNKIAELTAKVEELSKSAGKLPVEVERELNALRGEHATLDINNDPEFKKFDTTLTENVELIYKKLADNGVGKEAIDRIKELGGPDKVDWAPIMQKLPMPVARFVESMLVDNERVKDQREKALDAAKNNAGEYTTKRTARENESLQKTVADITKDIPWMKNQEVPAGATAEQKAAIEQANKIAEGANKDLARFISDRSPQRIAELAVGTLLAHRFKAEVDILTKQLAESTKISTENLTKITKERDELKAKLEAIKQARIPRGRTDAVAPAGVKKAPAMEQSGEEALTNLAKEAKENRAEIE